MSAPAASSATSGAEDVPIEIEMPSGGMKTKTLNPMLGTGRNQTFECAHCPYRAHRLISVTVQSCLPVKSEVANLSVSDLSKRASCLIIYTGGTVGMKPSADGSLRPAQGLVLTQC